MLQNWYRECVSFWFGHTGAPRAGKIMIFLKRKSLQFFFLMFIMFILPLVERNHFVYNGFDCHTFECGSSHTANMCFSFPQQSDLTIFFFCFEYKKTKVGLTVPVATNTSSKTFFRLIYKISLE